MVFFSVTDFFCTSGVSVGCSGKWQSRKDIWHGVYHTPKHGRELFTSMLIAFEKKDQKKDQKPLLLLPRLHFRSFPNS